MHHQTRLSMLKTRVAALRINLQKAVDKKLFRNFSICGFMVTTPRNGQTTKIMYSSSLIGEVKDGKVIVFKFHKDVWRGDIYKYDIICNISNEINGVKPADEVEKVIEPIVKKPPVKRTSKKKASGRRTKKV